MHFRNKLTRLLAQERPSPEPLVARELVLYGAGNCGRATAALAATRGLEVVAFLDVKADAKGSVDGVPCHKPGSAEARELGTRKIPVALAVFNYETDPGPIVDSLKASGFEHVISYYQLHEQLQAPTQFWLTDRSFYHPHAREILEGFDLFSDEVSQQIYCDCIALRLSFDLGLLRNPDRTNHYFPKDLPAPSRPVRMVDGGAYTGDTIEELLKRQLPIEALAAFEPDPANFLKLTQRATERFSQLRDLSLLPCGLGETTSLNRFAQGREGGSALHSEANTFVQVVALDEALPNFAPTFIKLDIEGAEPEALRGAAGLIRRYQPSLAVSVYHKPEHLWTIPAQMQRLLPASRLALRYHQFNGFDIVAYAIPE